MNDYYNPNITSSDIYKVIAIDHENRAIRALMTNGSIACITGLDGELPERGNIILLRDVGWETLSTEFWPVANSIAIVKKVLDDGRVLVEIDFSIKGTINPKKINLSAGNTIEFNQTDGVVSLVSEKPVVSKGLSNAQFDMSNKYLVANTENGLSFDDFGGYSHVVARARELIQNQLKNRNYLDAMKVRPIRGILLTGSGTGKTFLARIIAQEAGAKFFLVNGPAIVSKWLGDTEGVLRNIFESAVKSENGAIIFFDEIDSIASDRSGDTHEASKKLVAQLLTLMDGFDEKGGKVVVVAATNRANALDPALTRPGRFDWEIEFGIPTADDRHEILTKSIKRHQAAANLPINEIVELTNGWSAAELVSIIAEAGQVAASDKRSEIAAEDFAQGFERAAAKVSKRLQNEMRGKDGHGFSQ